MAANPAHSPNADTSSSEHADSDASNAQSALAPASAPNPRTMGVIRASRGGSLAGDHPPRDIGLRILAGPTTETHFNTIRPGLFPIACWRAEDLNFDFGSSFPVPDLGAGMVAFREIFDVHTEVDTDQPQESQQPQEPQEPQKPEPAESPEATNASTSSSSSSSSPPACVTLRVGKHPPISLFGHADPVGDDAYNKTLSGQRARAIYALLIRDVDAWKSLYSDNNWGDRSSQLIIETLGYPCGRVDGTIDQTTKDATKAFQRANSLSQSGSFDTNTRTKMYQLYMDRLCADASGIPYKLTKQHFLGQGKDSGFKADYQGCGEFNPVMLFSSDEKSHFNETEHRGERNNENAINRRVIALLFRPHTKIDVASWPCPRATEGTSGCAKRQWSDRTNRLRNGDTRREFSKNDRTFSCRFYDRMSVGSPCERGVEAYTAVLSVKLVSEVEINTWSDREIRIRGHGLDISTTTDANGCYFRAPVPSGDYTLEVGDAVCTLPALPFGSDPHILHVHYSLLPDTWGPGFFRSDSTELPEARP